MTLAKYKEVISGSDLHGQALFPMLIGMLFYVVGFYAYCAWATNSYATNISAPQFRARFKFLFNRWRPKKYFWGMGVISRNLLIAFAAVVSANPSTQLCYIVSVCAMFLLVTATHQPWLSQILNHFDGAVGYVLISMGVFGLVFHSHYNQVELLKELTRHGDAETLEEDSQQYVVVLIALIAAFFVLFFMIVAWALQMMMPDGVLKALQAHTTHRIRSLGSSIP